MCRPAPVTLQFGEDVERVFAIPQTFGVHGPGGVHLGVVGDQAHSTRRSSHNCAAAPGGQESPINGIAYAKQYAHAWDARPANTDVGYEMVRRTLMDDRVRYVLYADHGWYPDGTFEDITDNDQWSLDHDTFHVSFLPGTHNDTRPFFDDQGGLTVADIDQLLKAHHDTRRIVLQAAINAAKGERRILQAEWRTRKLLRDAGVLPAVAADESELNAQLDDIDHRLKALEAELVGVES